MISDGFPRSGTILYAPARLRGGQVLVAVLFGLLAFLLNVSIERRFDALRVFDQYNVLFDADPNTRLISISSGWGDRTPIHPHFGSLFSIPIRLTAKASCVLRGSSASEVAIRRRLALLAVPAVSGLATSSMFLALLLIGLSTPSSLIVTSIGTFSFSQLVFGSIPEHFAVGGLTISLCYLLAALQLAHPLRHYRFLWVAAGVLTMGVTTTNIVSAAILYMMCLIFAGRRFRCALLSLCAWLLLVSIITFGSAFVGAAAFGDALSVIRQSETASFVQTYMAASPMEKLARLPVALANTITPALVSTIPNTISDPGQYYSIQFTLEQQRSLIPAALWIAALLSGAIAGYRASRSHAAIITASILILSFNLAIHSLFGRETFLYSQHWLPALLPILGGNMTVRPTRTWAGLVLCFAVPLAVATSNARLLHQICAALASHSPAP